MACTRNIDVVLSRPGMYVVLTANSMAIVEVDEVGRCFQCTLDDHRRDGELRPGIWNVGEIDTIVGPFARITTPPAGPAFQAPANA